MVVGNNTANEGRASRAPWLIEAMDRCCEAEYSSVVESISDADRVLLGYGLDCHQSVLAPHSFPESTRAMQLKDKIHDGELMIHKQCAGAFRKLSTKLEKIMSGEAVRTEFRVRASVRASNLEVCRGKRRSPCTVSLPYSAIQLSLLALFSYSAAQRLQCKRPCQLEHHGWCF